MNLRILAPVVAVLWVGCTVESGESIGTHHDAARALPDTGFIPYPVLVQNGAPVRDDDNNLVASFDGSIVDLMAADALSQCSPWVSAFPTQTRRYVDEYLEFLVGKMEGAACGTWSATGEFSTAQNWFTQRTTHQDCNVDTSTGNSKLLVAEPDIRTHEQLTSNPYFILPTVNLTGPAVTSAIGEAQQEIWLAPMNLCIAERLRQRMVTADALVASGRDQRELLGVIRERAQVALFQYALIGLAAANPDPNPDVATTRYHSLAAIRAWAKNRGFLLQTVGNDFSQALRIHVEATRELAQLLFRSASARDDLGELKDSVTFSSAPTRADQDWGILSWRNRLLNVFHGGDPLGTTFTNERRPYGRPGGLPIFFFRPHHGIYVSVDAQAPEAWEMLGLARRANATYIALDNVAHEDPDVILRANIDRTTDFMYRKTEAFIRTQRCEIDDPTNPNCELAPNDPSIPPRSDFETSLLWQRFRIKPEQIQVLAQMLSQGAPSLRDGERDVHGALHFTGQHDHLLAEDAQDQLPGEAGHWFHIDPAFTTLALGNSERSTPVMLWGPLVPDNLRVNHPAPPQGFFARWRWNSSNPFADFPRTHRPEQFRMAGSASTLTALREAILTGVKWADTQSYAAPYFSRSAEMMPLIEAAIGRRTWSLRPIYELQSVTSSSFGACQEWDRSPGLNTCDILAVDETPEFFERASITVVTEASDPFVDLIVNNAGTPGDLYSTAARDPNFRSLNGFTRADLDSAARIPPTRTEGFPDSGLEKRIYEFAWHPARPYTTLLLSTCDPANLEYRVLSDGVKLDFMGDAAVGGVSRYYTARYGGFDGDFGRVLTQAFSVLPNNWSQPAFDAFGLPINWVPPPDPTLSALVDAGQSVGLYLENAKRAALEATEAVQLAINNLLEQERDNAVLAAAQERADSVKNNQKRAYCGDSPAPCNASTVVLNLKTDGRFLFLDCSGATGSPFFDICTELEKSIVDAAPNQLRVLALVNQKLTESAIPAFDEFKGGLLQQIAIRQWDALNRYRLFRRDVVAQVTALIARYNEAVAIQQAAQAAADAATQTAAFNCSPAAFHDANNAGLNCSDAPGTVSAGQDGSYSYSIDCEMASYSLGPWIAQVNACNNARIQVPAAEAAANAATFTALTVIAETWSFVADVRSSIADVFRDIQLASADMASAKTQAEIAEAEANLDARLAVATAFSRFGTARRYHQFDLWRARALLENARRHALTARRAIEANFVVDLSSLHQDEPFVAAPSVWADEVYEYDLDAPAAVGLQRAPSQEGAINANQLADYVTNLQNFVLGYSVNRPTAIAKSDSEVISLHGPDQRETVEIDDQGTLGEVLAHQSQSWRFFCENTGTWVQHPATGELPAVSDLATVCDGTGPSLARISFVLDAWGRIDGDVAQPPFKARHNVRWRRLAVNIVGTGIRDCQRAADPLACYSESFLDFDLRHVGPMWATNFDEQWRALGHPLGRIEAGKALALEEWVDPIANGWNAPFVAAVGRTELFNRPYGGVYEIDLHITPDVRLNRIERLQLLTESDYWVAQR